MLSIVSNDDERNWFDEFGLPLTKFNIECPVDELLDFEPGKLSLTISIGDSCCMNSFLSFYPKN